MAQYNGMQVSHNFVTKFQQSSDHGAVAFDNVHQALRLIQLHRAYMILTE